VAGAAAPVAATLSGTIGGTPYDSALTLRAMQRIAEDAENISVADERAAEQAAMALDSLYIAYNKEAKPANAAEVRAAINGLFQQLEILRRITRINLRQH